jgi:hypothetical protein
MEDDLEMLRSAPMVSDAPKSAPRLRRMLAGTTDAAVAVGLTLLDRRLSADRDRPGSKGSANSSWLRVLGPTASLVREQMGSPGQRLLGLRTVDRRTGRRVDLWRTLILVGAQAGGQALRRRLAPAGRSPRTAAEQESIGRELRMLRERFAEDPDALQAAMSRHYERHQVTVDVARPIGFIVILGLLNSWLRRRLAPTIDVLAREHHDHNP